MAASPRVPRAPAANTGRCATWNGITVNITVLSDLYTHCCFPEHCKRVKIFYIKNGSYFSLFDYNVDLHQLIVWLSIIITAVFTVTPTPALCSLYWSFDFWQYEVEVEDIIYLFDFFSLGLAHFHEGEDLGLKTNNKDQFILECGDPFIICKFTAVQVSNKGWLRLSKFDVNQVSSNKGWPICLTLSLCVMNSLFIYHNIGYMLWHAR